MKSIFLILLILLVSCKRETEKDELLAINELSVLKEWIEVNTENQDTLYWGDLEKLHGLEMKVLNPTRAKLEFVCLDKSKTNLIHFQNGEFLVFKLKKSIEIKDVNYILE